MPDSEARSAFPKILKAYMDKNGYNQSDIARYLHVSKQTVSEWVKGNKFPRVDKMQALADLFGVLMSDMYTPQKVGVVLKVNGSQKRSFADAIVKATVKAPDTDKAKDIVFAEKVHVPVFKDTQTKSMMKLWEVATPETKKAVIGFLKTMNKSTKR